MALGENVLLQLIGIESINKKSRMMWQQTPKNIHGYFFDFQLSTFSLKNEGMVEQLDACIPWHAVKQHAA
jgi:hypothetical protein